MTPLAVRSTSELLNTTHFGGRRLRRMPVVLGAERRVLVLHEEGHGGTFLLEHAGDGLNPGSQTPGVAALPLYAEWGEPLGRVQALETEPGTGRVLAYQITGRDLAPIRVAATDTYWWQGELYCHRRRAGQLRDLMRQAARRRARPAA